MTLAKKQPFQWKILFRKISFHKIKPNPTARRVNHTIVFGVSTLWKLALVTSRHWLTRSPASLDWKSSCTRQRQETQLKARSSRSEAFTSSHTLGKKLIAESLSCTGFALNPVPSPFPVLSHLLQNGDIVWALWTSTTKLYEFGGKSLFRVLHGQHLQSCLWMTWLCVGIMKLDLFMRRTKERPKMGVTRLWKWPWVAIHSSKHAPHPFRGKWITSWTFFTFFPFRAVTLFFL